MFASVEFFHKSFGVYFEIMYSNVMLPGLYILKLPMSYSGNTEISNLRTYLVLYISYILDIIYGFLMF